MNARSFSSSVISIRRLYVLESRFSSVSRGDNLARKDLCHMVGALRRPLLGRRIQKVVSCRRAGRRARNTSALRLVSFARVADGRGSRAFEATRRAWVQTRRGVAGLA